MNEQNNYIIPHITETDSRGAERGSDIFSRLLKDRIVFISTPIDDAVSTAIIAQLLFLNGNDQEKDVSLYIQSPGGSITAGMAIYDTMNFIKPDIQTLCIGQACSMGAFLLAAGTKGKRMSLPNSRILIHQPSGGSGGQASDIEIQAREILRMKADLNKKMAKMTGQTIKAIETACDRDKIMTPIEAIKFGLIDKVVGD